MILLIKFEIYAINKYTVFHRAIRQRKINEKYDGFKFDRKLCSFFINYKNINKI